VKRREFITLLGSAAVARPLRHGYVEGQNVAIEYRWAEGRLES